ncbi:MAG: zinc-binding alcohol dehydrogenase [Armatimonadota bacterium]|nr:zinc-binding alcohol dehydrogenase [Armatimonadota bacterium]
MTQHVGIIFTCYETAELLPLKIETHPPGPGEVAGPTIASLISAGTELGFGYQGQDFPLSPGYASVFRVEEVGARVKNIKIGDIALAMGHHQSYQRHPASEVWPLPDGLAAQDATFARLMGVSMSTLVTTTARPPDHVVVTGLGPVGHLAAQIFQACGYTVLASDPDATRRELAHKGGIAEVRDQLPLQDPHWKDKTALVLECSGHEQAALDACRLVKKRGEVVLIGVPWRQRTQLSAHELLHAIFHRYAVVRSGWEWEVPKQETEFRAGSIYADIEAALKWLHDGKIRVSGLYSVYDPRDCQDAYQALLHAREKSLAIVFDWTKFGAYSKSEKG